VTVHVNQARHDGFTPGIHHVCTCRDFHLVDRSHRDQPIGFDHHRTLFDHFLTAHRNHPATGKCNYAFRPVSRHGEAEGRKRLGRPRFPPDLRQIFGPVA
jgi:hypothetical protein